MYLESSTLDLQTQSRLAVMAFKDSYIELSVRMSGRIVCGECGNIILWTVKKCSANFWPL